MESINTCGKTIYVNKDISFLEIPHVSVMIYKNVMISKQKLDGTSTSKIYYVTLADPGFFF